MIDLKKLKELVKLMADNDLTELDLQDDGERVSLKRGSAQPAQPQVQYVQAPPTPSVSLPPAGAPASGIPAGSGQAAEPAAPVKDDSLIAITSPMVGTYYSAPNPDSDAFVKVGSSVDPQSVVCIIEAMKVFNEIKAEVAGTVAEILVENGQAVEFGQPLFLVKKK